jgi:hypothetical protein
VSTDDHVGADRGDVERYEQLRRRALDGDPSGWRAGLAVLQHHGVTAWLRAWRSLPAAPPSRPPAASPGAPLAGADRLVETLASMALGCLAAGG